MNRNLKRIAAILLALAMLAALVPAALAELPAKGCGGSPDGSHDWGFIAENKAATCTEGGEELWACLNCGEAANVSTPALGHLIDDSAWTIVKNPTCEEGGLMVQNCGRCGERMEKTIPAPGHQWDGGVVTKEATVEEEGIITYTCALDHSHTRTETIPRLPAPATEVPTGVPTSVPTEVPTPEAPETILPPEHVHEWGPWVTYKLGTCVQRETLHRECAGCGKVEWTTGSYGDHVWGEWQTVKAPTPTEPGLERRVCTLDPSHTEEREIPPQGDPAPALSVTVSQTPGYEQGIFQMEDTLYLRTTVTNTGNVTFSHIEFYLVYTSAAMAGAYNGTLAPGESEFIDFALPVVNNDNGYYKVGRYAVGWFDTAEGEKTDTSNTAWIRVPLSTGEEGGESTWTEEPDEKPVENPHPGLLLVWTGDSDLGHGLVVKDVFNETESVFADYTVVNTGNVPLRLQIHPTSGAVCDPVPAYHTYMPGESLSGVGCGFSPIGSHVDPGTDTAELLGTATVSFYFSGHDPYTGEELCQSETITRTWKVARPGPEAWSIPDESILTVTQNEESVSSNPAGYSLGESYSVYAAVANVGGVDVPSASMYKPRTGGTDINNNLSGIHSMYWWIEAGTVTAADVAQGYVYFPPLILTWTDPVSGNELTAYSNELLLNVVDDPGLAVTKSLKDPPANGAYFEGGEHPVWEITVSNPTDETWTTVTVIDDLEQVGYFEELAPGESRSVVYTSIYGVDQLDVDTGSTWNAASASAHDAAGVKHWFFSNTVKAPAGSGATVPMPGSGEPWSDPDPMDTIFGQNIDAFILKAEISVPLNGEYYTEGEDITYEIVLTNCGEVDLESVNIYDSLQGLPPVETRPLLPAGQSIHVLYTHTVTAEDVAAGWVVNTAAADYTFLGGHSGATPLSNKVVSKTGDASVRRPDGGEIDTSKLPGDPALPPMEPVPMPDGTPVLMPDGSPVLAPEGTVPVLDPDGKPVTTPEGWPVLRLPDGTWCFPTPDGKLVVCDKSGEPLWQPDGSYTYVTLSKGGPDCCRIQLDGLGEAEGRFTLHTCASHIDAATAAEAAAADGTADGWKQAAEIWRGEIEELYLLLLDASDSEAKALVLHDRAEFIAYVSEYEQMLAGGDPAAAKQAVAELLRMQCAELCAMVHTVPAALPDSLTGRYSRLEGSVPAERYSRTIGAMDGSDSPLTEVYDASGARTLEQVTEVVASASGAEGRATAFAQAQRLWQIALDRVVTVAYRAADAEQRKAIAACRVTLDRLYSARKDLLAVLYRGAPDVAAEVLSNLYKNALFSMSK